MEPTSPDQAILDSISTAVEEKTLSLSAIEAVQRLRAEHAETVKKVDRQTQLSERYRLEVEQLSRRNGDLLAEVEQLKVDKAAWETREKAAITTEVENKYLTKSVEDHKTMLLSLTRNLEYRDAVMKSHNGYDNNGGTNGTENTDTTRSAT